MKDSQFSSAKLWQNDKNRANVVKKKDSGKVNQKMAKSLLTA